VRRRIASTNQHSESPMAPLGWRRCCARSIRLVQHDPSASASKALRGVGATWDKAGLFQCDSARARDHIVRRWVALMRSKKLPMKSHVQLRAAQTQARNVTRTV
jgi:hypothetical protein